MDGGRVDEGHREAVRLESIHQPIPVVRRLDGDASERLPKRLELTQDVFETIRYSLVEHDAVLVVENHDVAVGGVQVDSAVQ